MKTNFNTKASLCFQLLDISYTSTKLSCRLVAIYNNFINLHNDIERFLADMTVAIRNSFELSDIFTENIASHKYRYIPFFINDSMDIEMRNNFRVSLDSDQLFVYLDWNKELIPNPPKAPLIRLLANMHGKQYFTYKTFFETVNNIHHYKA